MTTQRRHDERRELDQARSRLQRLLDEQGRLAAETAAAQRNVDVEGWMRLKNRAADLPAEIHRARLDVLPLELADAWAVAETVHAEETRLAEVNAAARKVVDDLYLDPHSPRTDVQVAERRLAFVKAKEAQDAANAAHHAARDATCLALARVDDIEAELVGLTGEPIEHGDGLRAAPRPLTTSVVASRRDFGVLAERLDEVIPGPDDRSSRALLPGFTPPRWLTHRMGLGDRFFSGPAAAPPAPRPGRRPSS